MVDYIDADTNAFNDYMKALKLPKNTPEDEAKRNQAMQDGLKTAIQVPLQLAIKATTLFEPLLELAAVGNANCRSDLEVSKYERTSFEKFSTYWFNEVIRLILIVEGTFLFSR